MSFNATANIANMDINDGVAKGILLTIAAHANKHGTCYPSVRRIAQLSGFCRRVIFAKLKVLEAMGLIKRSRQTRKDGGWRANIYRLAAALMVKAKARKRQVPASCTGGGAPYAHQEQVKKKPNSFALKKCSEERVPSTKGRSMGMNSIGDILSKAMNRATA